MSHTSTKAHPVLYHSWRKALRLWFRLAHRPRFFHPERIPKDGPCLIVANHQSFFDPPLIGCPVHWRLITFLSRASLYDSKLSGGIIKKLNTVPIRDGEGDIRAIRDILDRLKQGEAVLIFPEGSRTFDGALQPFRDGAALIIRRAKCPVIPVAVEGAFDVWPRTKGMPKIGARMMVMYGEPLDSAELKAGDINAVLERKIDDMRLVLRARLRAESGAQYPARGPGDKPFQAHAPSAG